MSGCARAAASYARTDRSFTVAATAYRSSDSLAAAAESAKDIILKPPFSFLGWLGKQSVDSVEYIEYPWLLRLLGSSEDTEAKSYIILIVAINTLF